MKNKIIKILMISMLLVLMIPIVSLADTSGNEDVTPKPDDFSFGSTTEEPIDYNEGNVSTDKIITNIDYDNPYYFNQIWDAQYQNNVIYGTNYVFDGNFSSTNNFNLHYKNKNITRIGGIVYTAQPTDSRFNVNGLNIFWPDRDTYKLVYVGFICDGADAPLRIMGTLPGESHANNGRLASGNKDFSTSNPTGYHCYGTYDTNIPLFSNYDDYLDYMITGNLENCFNNGPKLEPGQLLDDNGNIYDSTMPTFNMIKCTLNKSYSNNKNYTLDINYDLPADLLNDDYELVYRISHDYNFSYLMGTSSLLPSSYRDKLSSTTLYEKHYMCSSYPSKYNFKVLDIVSNGVIGDSGFALYDYTLCVGEGLNFDSIIDGVHIGADLILKCKYSDIKVEVKVCKKNSDGSFSYGNTSVFNVNLLNGNVDSYLATSNKDTSTTVIDGTQGTTTIIINNDNSSGGSGGGSSGSTSNVWDKLVELIDKIISTLTYLVVKLLGFVIDALDGILDKLFKLLTTLLDGIMGLLDFIVSGFGLLGENSVITLISDFFSFLPNEVIVAFSLTVVASCIVVVIKIIRG